MGNFRDCEGVGGVCSSRVRGTAVLSRKVEAGSTLLGRGGVGLSTRGVRIITGTLRRTSTTRRGTRRRLTAHESTTRLLLTRLGRLYGRSGRPVGRGFPLRG